MNWKFLRKIAGAVLILLGALALLTPLTPGGWLVFVGAELLGIEMLSPHRLKEWYARIKKPTGPKEEPQKGEE
jgi:hypothetical protein